MTSTASPEARRGQADAAGLRGMGGRPQNRGEPPPAARASQGRPSPPGLSSPEQEAGVWPSLAHRQSCSSREGKGESRRAEAAGRIHRPWLAPHMRARNQSEENAMQVEEGSRGARTEGITGSCSPGGGGVCADPPWGPGLLRVGLPSWGSPDYPPQLSHKSSTPIRFTQGGFCVGIC